MKKLLTLAAVAAMTVSTGAWAACSANIDMGQMSIMNIDPTYASGDEYDGEVATKTYVDAVAGGAASEITPRRAAVAGLPQAVQQCANLDFEGHTDWRLPTMDEIMNLCHLSNTADSCASDTVANVTATHGSTTVNAVLQYTPGNSNITEVANTLDTFYRCVR